MLSFGNKSEQDGRTSAPQLNPKVRVVNFAVHPHFDAAKRLDYQQISNDINRYRYRMNIARSGKRPSPILT